MFKLIPSKTDVVALCDVGLLCKHTHTHTHMHTHTPQKKERRYQEYSTEKYACRTSWGYYIIYRLPNNTLHIAVFIHCLLTALPSAGLHTNALQSYRHWGHSQALPIWNQDSFTVCWWHFQAQGCTLTLFSLTDTEVIARHSQYRTRLLLCMSLCMNCVCGGGGGESKGRCVCVCVYVLYVWMVGLGVKGWDSVCVCVKGGVGSEGV